ncbi:MFS transporter [Streptomyces sp. NBC_01643]|uniref:MFS transporter n=1 Tax=Streptomyces sp. NBC_01643 TaxID=2975906 RepID=UPI003870BA7C|nr:MHS family MFS transporter [Streptomyces sp. NBC_01643]
MAIQPTGRTKDGPPMRRIAMASSIGTIIEFYDFAVFGTASALVFRQVFFPSLGDAQGLALALATFGVAFVARPFGAILFGHFGDRLGRKQTLVTTLLVMGGSTLAVGMLPTASTIGVAAPIALVLLRVLQGLAVGGEWAGASLLTAENAPAGRGGKWGLYPQLGPSVGFMISCVTFLILSKTMTMAAFLAWGWRIPFIASAALIAIGLVVRLSIEESPEFRGLVRQQRVEKLPIGKLLRYEYKAIVQAAFAATAVFALFYIGVTYMSSYGTATLGLSNSSVLTISIFGGGAFCAATICGAIASDRFGHRNIVVLGNLVSIPASLIVFPIVDRGSPAAFLLGLIVVLGAGGIAYGPLASLLPALFSAEYRYSGAGLAYNLAVMLGASVTPLVADRLLESYGSAAIGIYLAAISVASLACSLTLRESSTVARPLVAQAPTAE